MEHQKTIKVWDLAVRIFHWSLVVFFTVAYLSGEGAEDGEQLHAYAGYVVTGLISFRILWGLVGSKYARFSDFVYGPAAILGYLKSLLTTHPRHYLGHNPAGGVMVVALLITIMLSCWSGLEAYATEGQGPLAQVEFNLISSAHADSDEEEYGHGEGHEFWEEVHELTSHLALALVIIHILGVLVSSYLHKENLVRAMVTGNKEVKEE